MRICRRNNYLAKAELSTRGGDIRCLSGSFLDRKLKSGSWDISLSEDGCGKLMTVSGKYDAVGDGASAMKFTSGRGAANGRRMTRTSCRIITRTGTCRLSRRVRICRTS